MLTKDEILLILNRIGEETIVAPSSKFPYRVSSANSRGYSADRTIGALQAKLSIMLELAGRAP